MKSPLAILAVAGIALLGTGCMSFQRYGSVTRDHTVSQGADKASVFASMGEPDAVYSSGDTEVFVYRGLKGSNYFGLYSHAKRDDLVVVMDQKGIVLTAQTIQVARGTNIIAPIFVDDTHPISTDVITKPKKNYEYNAEAQAPAAK
jgi:hypothetical protein